MSIFQRASGPGFCSHKIEFLWSPITDHPILLSASLQGMPPISKDEENKQTNKKHLCHFQKAIAQKE